MEEIIICDIDGTIANIDHRRPHVIGKKKDFKTFYAKQSEDTLIETTVVVLEALTIRDGYKLLFVSGRPEKYRKVTEDWLRDKLISFEKKEIVEHRGEKLQGRRLFLRPIGLLMRPDDDNRSDAIVKEEIYLNQIKPRYKVFMVFDDRNKVVDMWRKHGLVCHQVADGNF